MTALRVAQEVFDEGGSDLGDFEEGEADTRASYSSRIGTP